MKNINQQFAAILCALSLLPTCPAWAAGPVHGAKGSGMGTAFVATADDPSAIAANPAGLTRSKGTNIYGGVTAVMIDTSFINPAGQSENTKFQTFFPPSFFASSDFGMKDVVIGIGLYSPFGIGGRKWSENGLTRYAATDSAIGTFNVNPAVAWQISPSFSVGGGFYYMYATNRAERMIDQSAMGAGDGKMVVDGDGDGWGYNLGALLDINENLSLGIVYRSRSRVSINGTATLSRIATPLQPLFGGAEFNTDAGMEITFPEVISLGIAFKPSRHLTLEVDGELVRWSSLDRADIHFGTQIPQAGFTNTTAVYDWKDSWQIKLGADYRMTEEFSLRAGYAYIGTQVPDQTLNPASPEEDQHNFALGIGYRTKSLTIDSFYMIGIVPDRTSSNGILNGTYENMNHYLGISIGKRF